MMVAMAHAAPTAPAPIIPIFMMVLVFVKFSMKAVREQGRRHALNSQGGFCLNRKDGIVSRQSKFQHGDNARLAYENSQVETLCD
jgi:hypothetical protein